MPYFFIVVITDFITLFISASFVVVEAKCALRAIENIINSMKKTSEEPSYSLNSKENKVAEKKNLEW